MMYTSVSPRYFETVGIRIEAGRGLSEQDRTGAIAVAVLNAAAVRQIFPGENPIGHTLRLPKGTRPGESERLLQVVGVVSDTRQFGPLGDLPGQIYVPYRQASPQRMDLVIRAQGDPAALVSSVRTATSSIDRDQPVYNIATMEGLLAETVEGLRFHMFLVGSLAATALLLALIGITGVVTFIVNLRQHEVAMRMALGAQHGDILRLFARYATFLVASGLLAGTLVSLGAGRVAVHVFYGANIADPVAIALALPVLAVAIWVVALLPARRASRVDLMKVLRQV